MFQKSTSWISEDDFYKPEEMGSSEAYAIIDDAQMNGQVSPTSEPDTVQPPPSVVHRRHNGRNFLMPESWLVTTGRHLYSPSSELQSGGKLVVGLFLLATVCVNCA